MTAVWFTSDQHYGHGNIIRYSGRPFVDSDEMNRALVANHNAIVSNDDAVWHLGDFALNEKMVSIILPLLKGRHRLVVGNHDRCHPCHKKAEAAKRRYLLYGFESVATEIHLGPWLLNHLPYSGDSKHEPRYPAWRPKDQGAWLLHGHVHEAWKVRGRMVNVGVDQWDFAPVRLETLNALRDGAEGASS